MGADSGFWVRTFTAIAVLGVAIPAFAAEPLARFAETPLLPVEDAYPHVSRDGLVVFQSTRAGGTKLFVARLDGSGLRQLTQGPSIGRHAEVVFRRHAGRLCGDCERRQRGHLDRQCRRHGRAQPHESSGRRQPPELVAGRPAHRLLLDPR